MSASAVRISVLGVVLAVGIAAVVFIDPWKGAAETTGPPSLISGLKDRRPDVRAASAASLGQIGRDDPAARVALIEALGDASENVRVAAADSLAHRVEPEAVRPLAAVLDDPSPIVRGTAAYALGKFPDLEPAVASALVAAFKDPVPFVRSSVLTSAFARAGAAKTPDDPRVTLYEPLVLSGMKDPDPTVRRTATLSLRDSPAGGITHPEQVALALAGTIGDADRRVRIVAVIALPGLLKVVGPKLGPPTLQALAAKVPELVSGLSSEDRQDRGESAAAIVALGGVVRSAKFRSDDASAAKSRAALSAILAHPRHDVRPGALPVLPAAAPLVGYDVTFFEDKLRSSIADPALHRAAVNAARDLLNASEPADEAMGKVAIGLLRPILKDEDNLIRSVAYTALWRSPLARKLGGDALRTELREATRSYIATLSDSNPAAREVAAWCLSWTDPEDADAALTALTAAREDKEPRVKERVAKAVASLESAKSASAGWPEPSWEPFLGGRRRPGGR